MSGIIENGVEFYTKSSLDEMKVGESVTDAILTKRIYIAEQMRGKVKLIGRTKFISEGILCDHPASGIEFRGFMSGDVNLLINVDGDNYFTVYIDEKRVIERLYPRESSVTIASFEGKCFHTVKILKQSESVWTRSTINGIELTGELIEPPKPRDILIEVLSVSTEAE